MKVHPSQSVEVKGAPMMLPIIFTGGCEDSSNFRKVHLLNEETDTPFCGQHFQRGERSECSWIGADDFFGIEACSKCLKHKEVALNSQLKNKAKGPS